ncbi:1,4-alpha-glucan branching enzyme, partial [Paraburkholderia sp. BR14261]
YVRAWLPNASGASVVARDRAHTLGELSLVHPAGLYAGPLAEAVPYRLVVDWHGVSQEIEDTYSFGPQLSHEALVRLADGDPYAVLECLGARPLTCDGIPGVRFAVWAPNAKRVSVVGDFNAWDGRRHPMRLRHEAGVWELFIPRVAAGARYKYEILGARGAVLPLKADPCALQTECPPGTASIVAPVEAIDHYAWRDHEWLQTRAERQNARAAMSVYEVHAPSWLPTQGADAPAPDWG